MAFGEKQFENKPLPEKNQKETMAPKPFYEDPEEVKKKLEEKGVEKKNVEAALNLMKQINILDKRIFPENQANFDFEPKESPFGNLAGFVRPEREEKERSYRIFTKDLAKSIKDEWDKEVSIFSPDGQLKKEKQYYPSFLLAVHEIRHRVQHDRPIRQFSPEDAKLVKDNILRSIIKFQEMVFKEDKKIYLKEKRSEEFIKDKLNPKEFDAMVIERLIGNKLNEIPKRLGAAIDVKDLDDFASILQMSAPEKEKMTVMPAEIQASVEKFYQKFLREGKQASISLEDLREFKEKKVTTEHILDYLGQRYGYLFHGSREKIELNDKLKSRLGRIFTSDKAAISIMRAIYSNKYADNLGYPYFLEKQPLILRIKGMRPGCAGEKGFIYVIPSKEGFENDPQGSWQWVKKGEEQSFMARVEIEKDDFKYPVKILPRKEKK